MSVPEDDRINEVASELQGSTAADFDDIYLPGIGVRGALSDDGAESSDFRSNIGETCIRGAVLVNGWAIRTVRSVRRIASRLVVKVTNIDIRSQTAVKYRPKFPTQMTNWRARYLPQTGWHLSNAFQAAIRRFRSATSALALLLPRRETVTRIRQEIHSWLLRVAQSTSIQIQRADRFRLSPFAISETAARNLRCTQSFLNHVVVDVRNRLPFDASYRVMLRAFVNCMPGLSTLRRSAAPLAILLIMVVFVVQQIAVAVKH
jgi:hypothetical protein